jgi:hypothetical protein
MIQPAIPQFLQPDVPAPLDAHQTQLVVTEDNEGERQEAAHRAIAEYVAGDPPAGIWAVQGDGSLNWIPATEVA